MANLVEDLETYFLSLTATSAICSNFGTTFTSNANLFIVVEPASPTNSLTIIPYGGSPPDNRHKYAQYPSVQIRIKASTAAKGYKTGQAVINTMHQNDRVGSNIKMKCFCKNSAPIFLKFDEEDYPVWVINMDIMHVKYTVS